MKDKYLDRNGVKFSNLSEFVVGKEGVVNEQLTKMYILCRGSAREDKQKLRRRC